ncbi:restriction modification system DNA specificity domain [Shewanella baltica OS155]|uniref:Restriction modification system DNA specificity domain n=2 Tax=Shewanella baltica TaxID=62322 RepID=A3D0S8_SHEB5|nr:restriction modification system DNA specificity domain [Shewanella baltica OS155]
MQMPQIATPDTDKFLVPIPCPDNPEKSLAIQAEIVRILDAFTAMTTELTTELSLRKKQYNYYRDQLLSFEECDVEWKTLEEVAHFANGKGHEKDISEDGKFIVVNSKFISTDGLVAKYSHSQICPLFKDDILLVMSDLPNGKALSKTFIVDEDERYTLNQRIGGITVKDKSEMLPKFLHYYLNRTPQLLKHDNGVDQTNLRKGQILEVKVPILPLQKQEHIVSILDKFDKLTKSLSEGLPREIELRQKQYEYYRDLLLSFPKSDEAA